MSSIAEQQATDPHTPRIRAAAAPPDAMGDNRNGVMRALTPIRERGGNRRRRKMRLWLPHGVSVMEKPGAGGPDAASGAGGEESATMCPKRRRAEGAADREMVKRRFTYRRLKAAASAKGAAKDPVSDDEAALEQIPAGFAQDFFMAPVNAKPLSTALGRAAADMPWPAASEGLEASSVSSSKARTADAFSACADVDFTRWFGPLQLGFSILVQGVGSKWRLLEDFADTTLIPWGAVVVRVNCFDARFSLSECLRDILEQVFPAVTHSGSHSAEALANTISGALRGADGPGRPICLVVHNLECLQPSHQAALAGLAAKGMHIVASVDNIWASLAWSPLCLRDFNFSREEVHTFDGYGREHHARFPHGMPPWCDPMASRQKAPKASLSVVLRSLTRSHRELVQAMAEQQLAAGGGAGQSLSKLLTLATDAMIANTAPKLRSLLNELKDHEVIAQRTSNDGSALLYLTCDNRLLQRLVDGRDLDDESGEEEGAQPCAVAAP